MCFPNLFLSLYTYINEMKNMLLNRVTFKESVFNRDKYKCVICGKDAVDAHHIIDRSCFNDGGYYINNGVSLCSNHHLDAEKGYLSCKMLREKAGIKDIILPVGYNDAYDYDKWGKEIPNGNRKKYPHTYHLEWSEAVGGMIKFNMISQISWEKKL